MTEADVLIALAKILCGQARHAEALDLLLKVHSMKPNDPEVMLYIGLCCYYTKSYDTAYKFLLAGIDCPDFKIQRASFFLAMISYINKKDFKGAYYFFNNALTEPKADRDTILFHLGVIDFAMGNYDLALKHLYASEHNETDRLYYFRAMANIMTENHERALEEVNNLINANGLIYGSELIKKTLTEDKSAERIRGFMSFETQSPRTKEIGGILALYARELGHVFETFRGKWHLSNFLNELDGLALYGLIRHFRPRNVIEFSPYRGCSTVYIYKALMANKADFTFATFDIHQCLEFSESMSLFDIPLSVTSGDAISTVPEYIKGNNLEGSIDLCFVDSDHSYEFAKAYSEKIFPLLGKDCVIMIHDMYYKPNSFDLPFDHYEHITVDNICENPASVGEARAVREFFEDRDDYRLFSTHRLFGGIGDCSPVLPLNVALLKEIGIDLYNLEQGKYWNQPPMLIVAVPQCYVL